MMTALTLQQFLNVVRTSRDPEPLRPIPENGKIDGPTRKALKAFQHEHNLFAGRRVLEPTGHVDPTTREAIEWWSEVLGSAKMVTT